MNLTLSVAHGPLRGLSATFSPPGGGVGRSPDNLLCLPDTNVSARHAQLVFDGQRWTVVDLQSKNGTFLGHTGLPVGAEPVALEGHEVLVLAGVILHYTLSP